jgi:hypothetical protein
MIVKVLHKQESELVHVANITVADGLDQFAALEKAYFHTQNILHGSWSIGATFDDGEANRDYDACIERIAQLPEHGGRTYGLRSSMIGDIFEIEGARFVCASFGFEAANG